MSLIILLSTLSPLFAQQQGSLSTLWKDKPAVLVTASVTCPISVGSCPSLKPLSLAHSNDVNVGILYVKEAHPSEDGTTS